ncbi:MAG: DUF2235 domain-containing protein [Gammaproteobacteria bacterium]|nr:DUF2235 domain-containing protein [Gammaproteobacteria bacterium]
MKKLIVCVDGTWNTPTMEDNGEPAPTNVFKFYRALDDECNDQCAYYHTGIGTEGGRLANILDGAFGGSLEDHIRDVYLWLAERYEAGDDVYLLGFSRGAFTVRCVAGMLKRPGLVTLSSVASLQARREAVGRAYEAYADKDQRVEVHLPDDELHNEGKAVPVRFLGVWDTVGALGIPDELEFTNLMLDRKDRWEFHDTALGENVKTARHAMALDEIRASFTVSRWDPASFAESDRDVGEKWFPGVHGDIGGGYEDSSLSDLALEWMIDEAKQAGLQFHNGVSGQIKGNPLGVMHQSYKGVFAALRSRPRRAPMIAASEPSLDKSVIARQQARLINAFDYWPTKRLPPAEQTTVEIHARERWNRTGLYVKNGEAYSFDAEGEWMDKGDICDWRGTEKDDDLTRGDLVRGALSLVGKLERWLPKETMADLPNTKRLEGAKWFELVGVVANDGGKSKAVKNDGSPLPHTYFQPCNHSNPKRPFVVKADGYLYAFANDAWARYDNNQGSVRLVITRVS